MSSSFLRRSGWVAGGLLIVAAAIYIFGGSLISSSVSPFPSPAVAQPVGDLPNMPDKPKPQEITFAGCPPEGSGGDKELNLLKNRVDQGKYVPVSFDSLTTLTWPKNIEQQDMNNWPLSNLAFINQYQGIPVQVEGYILSVREGLPDPANCNQTKSSSLDWQISFTQNSKDDRSQAVIVEVTPRERLYHKWTIDLIHAVFMGDHLPVRISGWLYFDPEHPDDVGQIRATLWEIQPVMLIEVFKDGQWIPLDNFANSSSFNPVATGNR
jgi:hypothetical protein